MWIENRALDDLRGLEMPSTTGVSWVPPPLICGSDDDRANLMWKRYLEREDSKIVGMEWGKAGGVWTWGT